MPRATEVFCRSAYVQICEGDADAATFSLVHVRIIPEALSLFSQSPYPRRCMFSIVSGHSASLRVYEPNCVRMGCERYMSQIRPFVPPIGMASSSIACSLSNLPWACERRYVPRPERHPQPHNGIFGHHHAQWPPQDNAHRHHRYERQVPRRSCRSRQALGPLRRGQRRMVPDSLDALQPRSILSPGRLTKRVCKSF